jgi:lysozyme
VRAKTHRTPIVYTSIAWWKERGLKIADAAQLGDFKFWVADYSKSARAVESPPQFPISQPVFWQFSESARITQGYAKQIDANILKGEPEDFKSLFGVALP